MHYLFILLALAASAAGATFQVSLNTFPLIGNSAGPFSLEFQLTDGSGLNASNTAITLSQFDFGGGSGDTPSFSGGAAGGYASGFTLQTSDFFNEVRSPFTPGNSLSFKLGISTITFSSPFPDEFSFAILDGNGAEIATSHPFNVLLLVDLTDENAVIEAYDSQAFGIAAPGAVLEEAAGTTVPEPSTAVLAAASLAAVLLARRRRSSSAPLS